MDIIPYSRQEILEEDIEAVQKVLRSDFLTQGPKVEEFEDQLSKLLDVNYAVACSHGTSALHLSYASLGAGPGSISVIPAVTFSATANAMLYTGGGVRFCDVDPKSGLICPDSLKSTILITEKVSGNKTNFIAPVSLSGATAPLEECFHLGQKFGYQLIEDASHSILSYREGVDGNSIASAACEFSESACLSFHPVKHICCGEGGAVLTNSKELAGKIKRLRSHGMTRPYGSSHETPWFYQQIELGWNYRLTDIQAALGLSQLSRIHTQVAKRKKLAQTYNTELSRPPFTGKVTLPSISTGHSWHLYVIHLSESKIRDDLHRFLKEHGILTQVHYIPLYKHPYFKELTHIESLPGAEEYFKGCLSIPLFPGMTTNQQHSVIEHMASFFS